MFTNLLATSNVFFETWQLVLLIFAAIATAAAISFVCVLLFTKNKKAQKIIVQQPAPQRIIVQAPPQRAPQPAPQPFAQKVEEPKPEPAPQPVVQQPVIQQPIVQPVMQQPIVQPVYQQMPMVQPMMMGQPMMQPMMGAMPMQQPMMMGQPMMQPMMGAMPMVQPLIMPVAVPVQQAKRKRTEKPVKEEKPKQPTQIHMHLQPAPQAAEKRSVSRARGVDEDDGRVFDEGGFYNPASRRDIESVRLSSKNNKY